MSTASLQPSPAAANNPAANPAPNRAPAAAAARALHAPATAPTPDPTPPHPSHEELYQEHLEIIARTNRFIARTVRDCRRYFVDVAQGRAPLSPDRLKGALIGSRGRFLTMPRPAQPRSSNRPDFGGPSPSRQHRPSGPSNYSGPSNNPGPSRPCNCSNCGRPATPSGTSPSGPSGPSGSSDRSSPTANSGPASNPGRPASSGSAANSAPASPRPTGDAQRPPRSTKTNTNTGTNTTPPGGSNHPTTPSSPAANSGPAANSTPANPTNASNRAPAPNSPPAPFPASDLPPEAAAERAALETKLANLSPRYESLHARLKTAKTPTDRLYHQRRLDEFESQRLMPIIHRLVALGSDLIPDELRPNADPTPTPRSPSAAA